MTHTDIRRINRVCSVCVWEKRNYGLKKEYTYRGLVSLKIGGKKKIEDTLLSFSYFLTPSIMSIYLSIYLHISIYTYGISDRELPSPLEYYSISFNIYAFIFICIVLLWLYYVSIHKPTHPSSNPKTNAISIEPEARPDQTRPDQTLNPDSLRLKNKLIKRNDKWNMSIG